MIVNCVYVSVKPDKVEDFKKAAIENHNHSVQETGNLRFDILQNAQDPCRFLLYEAYESEQASSDHKTTAHYMKWKDTVADWMAESRQGVKYNIVSPTDKSEW